MQRPESLTARTESKAEVQIGLIRMLLAVVLGFATLYMISKAGPDLVDAGGRGLRVAIVAIGLYFALGFVSVISVWFGAYRGWMAWIFSLAEIALLSAALFFQMLGAGSLAALSSPVAFVIAAALVVQILYQRPALQIFSALLLIGATAAIVAIRPNTADGAENITATIIEQNYTGVANTARIFTLVMIAVIVGTAVARGRRTLNDVVAAAEERINVARFVPDELLNQMDHEDFPPLEPSRETELVVMVVELRGFTALRNELGAENAGALLDGFRERVSQSAARWNGVVERFAGDSAQVIFGLTRSSEAAARSAVDAALSLIDDVSVWNSERDRREPPIRLVVAVHFGEMLVGMIGSERRREFSAVGATISDTYQIASVAIQKDMPLIASEPVLHLSGIEAGGADWLDLGMGIQRADNEPVRLYCLNMR